MNESQNIPGFLVRHLGPLTTYFNFQASRVLAIIIVTLNGTDGELPGQRNGGSLLANRKSEQVS